MNNEPSTYTIDWQKLAREYNKKLHKRLAREPSKDYQYQKLGIPRFPSNLELRDYQQEAVVNWLKNKGRGTLKMATGSGKTIIGLAIATELYQKITLQVLLIICPYRHLVLQWERHCRDFNLNPICAMTSINDWQKILSNQLYNIASGKQKFLTIIATNSTFISDGFRTQLKFFPAKTLIIGDEAHNLGSTRLEASLPRNIGLRLALSATPQRYYDDLGTDALFDYFGEIITPEFTLADAIKKGALVPYLYYPVFVELTESESFLYAKLTKRIGWILSNNPNLEHSDTLTSLLTKRSRLIGSAANKLEALKDIMKNRLETNHTLFYCGDGNIENYHSRYRRQIEAVTRILGQELGYRVNTYTSDNTLEEREQLREQFENKELQGLVAIRCLDEGVDIPTIKTAVILASSTNPRQFIQRRGRILRPHPGKNHATLFDMIVIPPNLDRETWEIEKKLLQKELNRFIEFAELADNALGAKQKLLELEARFS
ncbi:MAG: DNA phosphorothioation system restriction enzyme [Xenococcaceae cyanobacterium MO_167.B52]|nr:DNA phosphorothioation system restriction enzyme [Xenococcaceae cyanobacterium MO_167.B52]